MSGQTSANLNRNWEADTDGPKDDKDDITVFSNPSNMSAHTYANLHHHWEADTDGPKDDKDDITAFRKFLVATLSIVHHDFRQLNVISLFFSVDYCSNFGVA